MSTTPKRDYIHVSNAYDVNFNAPSQLAASGAVRLLTSKRDWAGRCYMVFGMGSDPTASATFTVGDLVWKSKGSVDQAVLLILCTDASGNISWATEITGGLALKYPSDQSVVALSQPCSAPSVHAHLVFTATEGFTYRVNTYSRSLLELPPTLYFPPYGHKLNPASVKDTAFYIPNCPNALRQSFEITDADMRLLGAAQGGGTYTITSVYGGRTIWNRPVCMLDGDPTTYYNGDVLVHNNLEADGPYAFNARTCLWDGSYYIGEWFQIELPLAIKVRAYQVDIPMDASGNALALDASGKPVKVLDASGKPVKAVDPIQVLPSKHVLLGSMDGISWVLLDSRNGYTWEKTNVLTITNCFPMYKYKFRCFRLIPLLAKRGATNGFRIANFQLLADPDETFGVPRIYPPTVLPYVPRSVSAGKVCTQRVMLSTMGTSYAAGEYIASAYPMERTECETHGPMFAFNGSPHDVFFFKTADVSDFFPSRLNGSADTNYARALAQSNGITTTDASARISDLLALPYLQIVFPEAFVPETIFLSQHAVFMGRARPRTFEILASKSSSPGDGSAYTWTALDKRDGGTSDVFYVNSQAAYCTYRLVFTSVAPGFLGFFAFANVAFSTTSSVQAKDFPMPATSDNIAARAVHLADYGTFQLELSEERIAYRDQECIVTAPIDPSAPIESWAAGALLSGRNSTYLGRTGVYDASGTYSGSIHTPLEDNTEAIGEYVQMYFGTPIAPMQLVMEPDAADGTSAPKETVILASGDGRRWHAVSKHTESAPSDRFEISTEAQAVPCSWWRVVFSRIFPNNGTADASGARGVRLSKLGFRIKAGLSSAAISSPLIAHPMGELRPSSKTALSIGIEENPGTKVGSYFDYSVAASSSFSGDRREWNAFSNTETKYWLSDLNYSVGSGLYYGSSQSKISSTDSSGAVARGEWIEVTLPTSITPCAVLIHPLQLSVYGMRLSDSPVEWKLLATNQADASDPVWTVVASVSRDYSPWPSDTGVTVDVHGSADYRRYRLVIGRVAATKTGAGVITNVGVALRRFRIYSRKTSALECFAVDVRSGAIDWRASVLGDDLTGVDVQSINHPRASEMAPPIPIASAVLSFSAAGTINLGSWTYPGGAAQGSDGSPLYFFSPHDIYMFSSTHTQDYLQSLAGNCHVHVVSCARQTYSLGVNINGKFVWNMCSRVPGRSAAQRFEHTRTCNVFVGSSPTTLTVVEGFALIYAKVMALRAPVPMSNFTFSSLEKLLNSDVNSSSGDFYDCEQDQSYVVLHMVEYKKYTQTRSEASFLVPMRGEYAPTRIHVDNSKMYVTMEPSVFRKSNGQTAPTQPFASSAMLDTDLALPLKTWPARVRVRDASGCSLIVAAFEQNPTLRSSFLKWTVQLCGPDVATSVLFPSEYSGTAPGYMLVSAMFPKADGPMDVIGTQYTRLAPTGSLADVSDTVAMGQSSAYQAVLWSFACDVLPTSYPFKLMGKHIAGMYPLHKETDEGLSVLALPADASGAIAYSGLPNIPIWRALGRTVPWILRVAKTSLVAPVMLDRSRMSVLGGHTAVITCNASLSGLITMMSASGGWHINASVDGALESVGAGAALYGAMYTLVQTCACQVESYASIALRDFMVPISASGSAWVIFAKYDANARVLSQLRPLDPVASKISLFKGPNGAIISPCQPVEDYGRPVVVSLDANGSPTFNVEAHGDRYSRYGAVLADALVVFEGDPTSDRMAIASVLGAPPLDDAVLLAFLQSIQPDLSLIKDASGGTAVGIPLPALETRSSVNRFPLQSLMTGEPWDGIDSAVVRVIGTFMQAPAPAEPLDVVSPNWARELREGTVHALTQHLAADSTWSDVFKNALSGSDGQTTEYILEACSDRGLPIDAGVLNFISPMELSIGLTDIQVEASYDDSTSGDTFYSFLFDIPVLLRFK